MDSKDAIKMGIEMGQMICTAYLDDLTDEQLMMRPHPDCNHINWQFGHLISSEHQMVEAVMPGSMPALPDGFAEKYTRETASSETLSDFADKATLMEAFKAQREATLVALDKIEESRLTDPAPEPMNNYLPNVAAIFGMQSSHWLMHCGQWVVVRRNLGKPALF